MGVGALDEFEVSGFSGFYDSRRCEDDFAGGLAGEFDGLFVAAGVLEVAVDLGDVGFDGGFELRHRAGED